MGLNAYFYDLQTKTCCIMRTICLVFIALLTALAARAQDRITGRNFATRSEVIAKNGMAATSHPLATQVALDILKQGGSAVDAAIAANAALGLMEPTGCGIGGDLFAIVWDAKTRRLYGLNASGRSPLSLTLDYFRENGIEQIPAYGPLPVSVPGCVDGWFELHHKFGRLSMHKILAPSIQYAEEGFPLTELIAYYLQRGVRLHGDRFPNVYETYTTDGKTIPKKGDIFKNQWLADTYRRIARNGRDEFYMGETARAIADFIQKQGGFLTPEDLATHRSEWVDPVSTNYRGYDVWELPPSGHGIAALQMLNILESYDFSSIPFGSARHIHLFVEAKKLAFEDRAKYYADMDFAEVPVEWLISKEYASERRALINENRAGIYRAGEKFDGGTINLAVADKDGNIVSLIQSNYRGLGSGMVPPEMGFMLQNRGELFSLHDGHANVYAPGKRPFHTIIPAFVTKDAELFMAFGVMGGDFQPLGHVQILMNIIDFGMNLQEAGDAPRISHSGSPDPTGRPGAGRGEVELESGFDYEAIRQLMQMGHKVVFLNGGFGGYQAVMYDKTRKIYFGASESRKDGQAAGY
jgi:gamma-glutamyltranspeptidase / glutathione hydrolase